VPGWRRPRGPFAHSAPRGCAHRRRCSSDDPRRWRRVRRLLVLLCTLFIVAVLAGLPVYVRPQIDPLRHADAILVLGGRDYDRYAFGRGLGEQGWAPIVVLSIDRWRTGFCATAHPHFDLRCFIPDPPTTRGEAQELHRLATNYGWRTIIVVTYRPHISRARFILEQCFDGNMVMVESPGGSGVTGGRAVKLSTLGWAYQYLYQTAGYARAVLEPAC
jgi:uncharacterized SAM-binding protein YcdF (DUF218 family)